MHVQRTLLLLVVLALLTAGCEFTVPAMPVTPAAPQAPVHGGGMLTVAFLDIGQGDAILVRGPSGMTMLIDGGHGASDATDVILPALQAWGVKQLDLLVVTHPDADHIGGLPTLLQGFPVMNVALTGQVHTTQVYERLLTEIRDRKVNAIRTRTGTTLPFDPAVQLTVLGPDDAVVQSDDTNNASIVMKLVYGGVSFLLSGDAELEAYAAIQGRGGDLSATVLKVGHHGSSTSTDAALLLNVRPQIAVISVGAGNRYGHPHAEVLSALARQGVRVYRTDQQGTITVTTDGTTPTVQTEK